MMKLHFMIIILVLMLSGAVAGTSYVQVNGQTIAKINESGIFYYHSDNIGSTSAITNEAGDVIEEQVNLPFGKRISGSEKYGFTGKELDETGLQYSGLRFYDPATGRFLTVDPIKDGINWYGYARNNPLRFIDPTGGYVELILDTVLFEKGKEEAAEKKSEKYGYEIVEFLNSRAVEDFFGFNPAGDRKRKFTIVMTVFRDEDRKIRIVRDEDRKIRTEPTDGVILSGTVAQYIPTTGYILLNMDSLGITLTIEHKDGTKKEINCDPFMYTSLVNEIQNKLDYEGGKAPLNKKFIEERMKSGGEYVVTKDESIARLWEKVRVKNEAFHAQSIVLTKMRKYGKLDWVTYNFFKDWLEDSRKAESLKLRLQIRELEKEDEK